MVTRSAIRTIVGICGNVISFGLFASPSPTIWRIFKNKAVEEFKPDPYIAAVMNCLFWVLYGLPWNHPNSILVLTINGTGLVIEMVYLTIFFMYGDKKIRWKITLFLAIEYFCSILTGVLVYKFCHTYAAREKVIGIICVIFGTIMYGAPLTIMKTVVTTKSVEYMPFGLSLVSFVNGICWSTYALLQFDLFILLPNGIGSLLAAAQLILYGCYYKTTPKNGVESGDVDNKKKEIQLQTVV